MAVRQTAKGSTGSVNDKRFPKKLTKMNTGMIRNRTTPIVGFAYQHATQNNNYQQALQTTRTIGQISSVQDNGSMLKITSAIAQRLFR